MNDLILGYSIRVAFFVLIKLPKIEIRQVRILKALLHHQINNNT
jgi:hypothetical protein